MGGKSTMSADNPMGSLPTGGYQGAPQAPAMVSGPMAGSQVGPASNSPNPLATGLFKGMGELASGMNQQVAPAQGGANWQAPQTQLNSDPMGNVQAPNTGIYPRTSLARRGMTRG